MPLTKRTQDAMQSSPKGHVTFLPGSARDNGVHGTYLLTYLLTYLKADP